MSAASLICYSIQACAIQLAPPKHILIQQLQHVSTAPPTALPAHLPTIVLLVSLATPFKKTSVFSFVQRVLATTRSAIPVGSTVLSALTLPVVGVTTIIFSITILVLRNARVTCLLKIISRASFAQLFLLIVRAATILIVSPALMVSSRTDLASLAIQVTIS